MSERRQASASRRQAAGASDQQSGGHVPVLLDEVITGLALRTGDDAIDCTFGGGGYTRAMLDATAPDGRVLALDRDPDAIERAKVSTWVRTAGARLILVHANFRDIAGVAASQGIAHPRGIVADLGLSSTQLASSDRGFSFQTSGPLDMRFSAKGGSASGGDPTEDGETAADIIRTRSPQELERIFRMYGEEHAAGPIARAIVAERRRRPITTTVALAEIIGRAIRRRGRIHPATRVFQALRIAVNDELAALDTAIPQMLNLLCSGGRLAIVSFHSLEDRIVKRRFLTAERLGTGRILTKRPLRPTDEEIASNPRSRSAKLRVIEHG